VEISQTKGKITLGKKKTNLNMGGIKIKRTRKIIIFATFRGEKKKIL
jgi:hypothetical protein